MDVTSENSIEEWMLAEEARKYKEKQIPINLDNVRAHIEKKVPLLGHTSYYITYFRRYILAALNCLAKQFKEIFRGEAHLLQQHDRNLFGKIFTKHIVNSAK